MALRMTGSLVNKMEEGGYGKQNEGRGLDKHGNVTLCHVTVNGQ